MIAYTDGGSRGNPGPAGIGVVFLDDGGGLCLEMAEYIGTATNNVAEYTALLRALEMALAQHVTDLTVYTDSKLMEMQVKGRYQVKSFVLKELLARVLNRAVLLNSFEIKHIPRRLNEHADRLANQAMDNQLGLMMQK